MFPTSQFEIKSSPSDNNCIQFVSNGESYAVKSCDSRDNPEYPLKSTSEKLRSPVGTHKVQPPPWQPLSPPISLQYTLPPYIQLTLLKQANFAILLTELVEWYERKAAILLILHQKL